MHYGKIVGGRQIGGGGVKEGYINKSILSYFSSEKNLKLSYYEANLKTLLLWND